MSDNCPTHGTDCPGHLHAEVVGGKVYVSLPLPAWKRPDTSIDLEKVVWTAHPYMHPLQRFGSFLLSDTEIRFLKDHGCQPW